MSVVIININLIHLNIIFFNKLIMFNFLFLSLAITRPPVESAVQCCIDHQAKPISPFAQANYDCSQLSPFGRDRCNSVYGGDVCRWANNNKCKQSKCDRVSKYELHYGKYVDVGTCAGECKEDNHSCNPNSYDYIQLSDDQNKIPILKDCVCDSCGTVSVTRPVEINVDRCKGDCNSDQQDKVCTAGVEDQFSGSNGPEPSNPSPALVSGMLSGCSAGIQPGFDFFADNRCFGHTFTDCFSQGDCPLRAAKLRICM
mgnify:CR=1 FL=1